MRKGKALQARLNRLELANRLMTWLKENWCLAPGVPVSGGFEGNHAYEHVVLPFAKEAKVEMWEAWKAWEILREAGRRRSRPGRAFEILSLEPIEFNDEGNIKQ